MRSFRTASMMFAPAAASVALFTVAPVRAAGERQACVNAAEQGQSLRDSGKYVDARKQFLVCVREVCPAFVKKDCGEWLTQLESVAPTVVFSAKDGPRDLLDVKVYIDGTLALEKLDGTPIPTDPGPHGFKFEWNGQVREEQVVISAGQKGRNITASFGAAIPIAAAPAASEAAPPPSEATSRRSLVPALVAGGVGVLGLASFAAFAITGKSEESDLEGSCKPRCASDRVDDVRTKFIVADVSLGVGLVALGISTYMMLTRPSEKSVVTPGRARFRRVELGLAPTSGGAAASLGARF